MVYCLRKAPVAVANRASYLDTFFEGGAMPQTILCVDGAAAVRSGRSEFLRAAGFEILEAETGADALRLAFERRPSLIVLAIGPSGSDAFSICKQLKAHPRTAPIPVLVISPAESDHGCQKSLESGADWHLEELIEPAVLVDAVTALIRRQSGSAPTKETDEVQRLAGELQAVLDAAPVAIWIAHDPQCETITGNRMADQLYEAGAGKTYRRT